MLTIRLDLFGIEESILRPILVRTATDIKRALGITNKVYIRFDSTDTVIKRKNRVGDLIGRNVTMENLIHIEYEDESEDQYDLPMVQYNTDMQPIYIDNEINAKITPITYTRRLNITFRYCCKSKAAMDSLANRLRLYSTYEGFSLEHDLEYHYVIPRYALQLLAELNRLKNLRQEEKISLYEYITRHFDSRLDIVNTTDGDINKQDLVIREAQVNVFGYCDTDLHTIKPEYDESAGIYTVELNYFLVYEKPISLKVDYPVLVFNSLIGEKFRDIIPISNRNRRAHYRGSVSSLHVLGQEGNSLRTVAPFNYVRVPEVDNVLIKYSLLGYVPLVSILVMLNEYDTRTLCNIKDLPGVAFKPNVIDFIIQEGIRTSKHRQSIFHLALFTGKKRTGIPILLQPNGDIVSTIDLDLKQTYRVVVYMANDLDYMFDYAIARFINFICYEAITAVPIEEEITFQEFRHKWERYTKTYTTEIREYKSLIEMYLTTLSMGDYYYGLQDKFYPKDLVFNITASLLSSQQTTMLILSKLQQLQNINKGNNKPIIEKEDIKYSPLYNKVNKDGNVAETNNYVVVDDAIVDIDNVEDILLEENVLDKIEKDNIDPNNTIDNIIKDNIPLVDIVKPEDIPILKPDGTIDKEATEERDNIFKSKHTKLTLSNGIVIYLPNEYLQFNQVEITLQDGSKLIINTKTGEIIDNTQPPTNNIEDNEITIPNVSNMGKPITYTILAIPVMRTKQVSTIVTMLESKK